MRILLKITAFVLLATLLTSCCACRSYQKKNRRPLVGTQWQLIQLDGRAVSPEPGTFTLTLDPEQGRISGIGACNRLMGSYKEEEKGALTFGPVASTKMACPGLDQEHKFIRAVQATTHYDMDGPMLLLFSNGELHAVFQAQPQTK